MKIFHYVFFTLLIIAVQNASAGTSEARGGSGGHPFTMTCGSGEKIGGFQIRMGKVLDGLGIACVPINAVLNGNPIIDGFTGSQGGGDYRYNLQRQRYVKTIVMTACKYKGRTLVRSLRVSYVVPGQPLARGFSRTYGQKCDSRYPVITHSAPPGQHIYGIFGKSGGAVDSLGVVYKPLPVLGRSQRVSLAGLLASLNRLVFKPSRLTLDNYGSYSKNGGFLENGSRIDIGGHVEQFSIEPYSKRRKKGVYRVDYYINDVNASDIYVARGTKHYSYIDMVIALESKGREIKGFCRKKIGNKYSLCANGGDVMPDAEIESPRLRVQLVPQVFNGTCNGNRINSATLIPTASDFYGRIKIAGNWNRVPDTVESWLKDKIGESVLDKMMRDAARRVEKAVTSRLKSNQTQCQIAVPIRDYIIDNTGGVTLTSVAIDGGDLVIGY